MLTKAKLSEGGRKRWAGVSKAERRRVMRRARNGQRFKARKRARRAAETLGLTS